MPCNHMKLPGGGYAIVCTRGGVKRCVTCGRPSTLLCDFEVTRDGRLSTCDRPMCAKHAEHVGEDRDYCLVHAEHVRKNGEGNG